MKTIQYFSDEYLELCKKMTPKQILEFQENFRLLNTPQNSSKSIIIRLPENLLKAFKLKCALNNEKYQTMIKKLMEQWLG